LGNANAEPRNRHADAIATKYRPATLAMRGHNGAYEEKRCFIRNFNERRVRWRSPEQWDVEVSPPVQTIATTIVTTTIIT
jgi:hypothetical protein